MGVRTYEVTVERTFIVKGCSNKKQVQAKAPLQMFEGESISSIKEVKPESKSLPMPDISAVMPRRKKKIDDTPEIFKEEICVQQSPDIVPEAVCEEVLESDEGMCASLDLSKVVGDSPNVAEGAEEEKELSKEEVIELLNQDEEESSDEEPFYENVTNVDFVNKTILD